MDINKTFNNEIWKSRSPKNGGPIERGTDKLKTKASYPMKMNIDFIRFCYLPGPIEA